MRKLFLASFYLKGEPGIPRLPEMRLIVIDAKETDTLRDEVYKAEQIGAKYCESWNKEREGEQSGAFSMILGFKVEPTLMASCLDVEDKEKITGVRISATESAY